MADLHATIETMEHSFMRAWITGDMKALKALTARNFRMVIGAKPAVILDCKSWIAAAGSSYRCKSYRFGDIYVRSVGNVVVFATQLEMEATIEREDWSGRMWVTDLWQKGRVRRKWQMVERILSRPEERADVPAAVRSLQLWR